MNKVRYLTISRVSLELVEKLSDQENALFNRIIFSCFQQLEDGQELSYQETDSPILNVALREAARELETGYRNYIQKINARKKGSDPESESAIDQRSTADQPPIDNRREEKREGMLGWWRSNHSARGLAWMVQDWRMMGVCGWCFASTGMRSMADRVSQPSMTRPNTV